MRWLTLRPTDRVTWVDPPPVCTTRVHARATTDFGVEPSLESDLSGRRWSPERLREFVVGRRCAARALADAGAIELDVKVGPHRQPIWPRGFVGSITHSSSFALAAVGRSSQVISVGVDSEPILDEPSLAAVAPLALHRSEQQRVEGRLDLATVVFSAKESLFKCLYPLAGTFFDYLDAQVASLDLVDGRGVCMLSLGRELGARFARGSVFLVRAAIAGGHAHTCLELLP
jgi:4'-phosphopantetheinyl transferase EntD